MEGTKAISRIRLRIILQNVIEMQHWALANMNESFVRPVQIQDHVDGGAKQNSNDDPRRKTAMISQAARQTDRSDSRHASKHEQPDDRIGNATIPCEYSAAVDRHRINQGS